MNEDHERYEPCTADCVLRVSDFCVLCFVAAGLVVSVSVVYREVTMTCPGWNRQALYMQGRRQPDLTVVRLF